MKQISINDVVELLKQEKNFINAFGVAIEYEKTNKMSLSTSIKKLLYQLLKENELEYSISEDSRCFAFYDIENYRKDHVTSFKKVLETIENSDFICSLPNRTQRNVVDIVKLIMSTTQFIKIPQIKKMKLRQRVYYLVYWFKLVKFLNYIKVCNFSQYEAVVVYFDAEICSNVLVQMCKEQGIKTATLQHGIFVSPKENPRNIDECSIEFKYSVSDYFLAWSDFIKNEAIKAGMDEKKIKVLGIPKFIGEKTDVQFTPRNCFGVILGWIENDFENKKLIEVANEIARKNNMKYVVKYHPSFRGNEYAHLIDTALCQGNVSKEKNVVEYIKDVKFSIVGNSSLFVELLYFGHRTFHLHINGMPDKYNNITQLSFSNTTQFEKVLEESTVSFGKLQKYLCGPRDVDNEYKVFFKELLLK